MRTKRVAIYTNFNDSDPAYSLNRCVQDQITMLNIGEFEPVVIVAESFKPVESYLNAELRFIPNVPCHNDIKKDPTFDEDVKAITDATREALKDIDIVLTHDVIYQPAALKHNMACRTIAAERPDLKWMHWIHSATPPYTLINLRPYFQDEYLKLIDKPFPNSYYISFNNVLAPSIATNFNVLRENVKVVPHPTDICRFFNYDPIVTRLVKEKKMFEADAICIYPIRLDRGKQVEYVIKTMACMKDFGMNVRCMIADFHSTGGDKVTYREELHKIGLDWGLNNEELIFTSEFDEKWRVEVPWNTMKDLYNLSNVYMHPSVSETYSYTTQEAGLTGAVVVLNADYPPMRDIYGANAIYRKYSSNFDVMADESQAYTANTHTDTKYGPTQATDDERKIFEKNYHHETAGMIVKHLINDPSLSMRTYLRKYRNLEYVFHHYLEPLFYDDK